MKQYSFPKEKRICSRGGFLSILYSSQRVVLGSTPPLMTIYKAPIERVASSKLKALGMVNVRLGVSVSKSCGNAVKRNRLKRLVREVFRLNQHQIPSGFDYLVLIKRKIENPSFEKIQESFLSLVLPKNKN